MSIKNIEKSNKLELWFRENVFTSSAVKVLNLRKADSGLSNITTFFTIETNEGDHKIIKEYVLREPGRADREMVFSTDFSFQYHVLKALQSTALKVPKVLWYESNKDYLGVEFYIMERIVGQVAPDACPGFHGTGVFYDASLNERAALWKSALDQLVELHHLDWTKMSLPEAIYLPYDNRDGLKNQIDDIVKMYHRLRSIKILQIEKAIDWLYKNMYTPEKLSLLWGDARPGNIIFNEGRAIANLDWESASIGPPEFDLTYFIVSAEVSAELCQVSRLSGLLDENETVQYYLHQSGLVLEKHETEYAFIFTLCRMAVMLALHVQDPPDDLPLPDSFYTNNYCIRRMNQMFEIIGSD